MTATTKTVWVLVDFVGPDGQRYSKGSQIKLAYDTPDQKAFVDSLVRYGIVTANKPSTGAAS